METVQNNLGSLAKIDAVRDEAIAILDHQTNPQRHARYFNVFNAYVADLELRSETGSLDTMAAHRVIAIHEMLAGINCLLAELADDADDDGTLAPVDREITKFLFAIAFDLSSAKRALGQNGKVNHA